MKFPGKYNRNMPSFEGVAAGQTATLRCPLNGTYEQIWIAYAGVTLAQMTEIRVIANGKPIQRWTSGTRLDEVNQFMGRAAAAGNLCLDFQRYGLEKRGGIEVTGLGTGLRSVDTGQVELTTLAVEIDIDGAAAAPVLSAVAKQRPPEPLGFVRYIREFTHNPTAAGEYQVADLPKGHLFNSVHFCSSIVTEVRLEADNEVRFQRSKALNDDIQADGVRVPAAGYFVVDPTEEGFGGETIQTANVADLRFTTTVSGAGSMPVLVESIAPLAE